MRLVWQYRLLTFAKLEPDFSSKETQTTME